MEYLDKLLASNEKVPKDLTDPQEQISRFSDLKLSKLSNPSKNYVTKYPKNLKADLQLEVRLKSQNPKIIDNINAQTPQGVAGSGSSFNQKSEKLPKKASCQEQQSCNQN